MSTFLFWEGLENPQRECGHVNAFFGCSVVFRTQWSRVLDGIYESFRVRWIKGFPIKPAQANHLQHPVKNGLLHWYIVDGGPMVECDFLDFYPIHIIAKGPFGKSVMKFRVRRTTDATNQLFFCLFLFCLPKNRTLSACFVIGVIHRDF